MKRFSLLALLCVILCGCKKSTTNPTTLQVQVSGLTSKTSVTIKMVNQNNLTVLNLANQFGNTTYTASPINVGDVLTITISTNIPDDTAGDGDGTVEFIYAGVDIGSAGGILTRQPFQITIHNAN